MSLWDKIKNWFTQKKKVSDLKKVIPESVVKVGKDWNVREITKGRLITVDMFHYILKRMPEGFEKLDAHMMFVFAMEAMIGIKESGGDNKGKEVEGIQDTVGKPEKESWCMSTIQTAIAFVEVITYRNSPFPVTESCVKAYEKSLVKYKNPKIGLVCIWIKERGPYGHTGAVSSVIDRNSFMSIEGNTGDGKEVEREGDKICSKSRSLHPSGKLQILGFLEPFPV